MTTSNIPTVATVDFQGAQLITIRKDELEFVAMKPVSDGIGLNWQKQSEKLQRDKEKFNCTLMGMVAADGKNRQMLCMPITKLNGWLFSINPNKIPNPQTREKVVRYQEECFIALYDYWHKGKAERFIPETLTPSEQHQLTTVVKFKAEKNGKAIAEIWGRVKNKFKVAKYDQISRDDFQAALEYVASMEVKSLVREVAETSEPKAEETEQQEPLSQEERNAIMDDIYNQIGHIRMSVDNLLCFYRDTNRSLNKIGNLISILNDVDYKDRRRREMQAGR